MGEKMATRKKKLKFQLVRLKNFTKALLKNKKSRFGVIILTFFVAFAIIGPETTKSDPLRPGSSAIEELPVAMDLCLPSWYRLFDQNLTETMYIISDPEFRNPNINKVWTNIKTSKPEITVEHSNAGLLSPGSTKIAFPTAGTAQLSVNFSYPFQKPIESFKIWFNVYVNATLDEWIPVSKANVTLKAFITKGIKTFPVLTPPFGTIIQFNNRTTNRINTWLKIKYIDAFDPNLVDYFKKNYGDEPRNILFSSPSDVTFTLTVTYNVAQEVTDKIKNVTFLIDDFYIVLYGKTYGLLGTDNLGRDLYAQLAHGARISLIIGLGTAAISVLIGLIVGLVAGFIGGAVDEVLMRFTDMLMVLPTLPLLLVLIFVMGQSMLNIILVLTLLGWMGFSRTVRSMVLSIKERQYIEAAKAAGAPTSHIITKHIIPNVASLVYVSLALSVPSAIISEAALSWLGLGPLDVMTWGRMLYEFENSGLRSLGAFTYWYWTVIPGLCIAALSLAFILIGYAMDEILNPKLRERR
jgi:peptide/nickel transport system permease protein